MGVHHMEAHALLPLMTQKVSFPYLALLVSGGHTTLVLCTSFGKYHAVGSCLDDAMGEAADKVTSFGGCLPFPFDWLFR
jgi:N6-L-threonylcarbamoyladenine synthase